MSPTNEENSPRAPGRDMLAAHLAAFVTATSSTANALIDSTSLELTKRIAKQIKEIEKERDAAGSLPITLE
jgi:hypothetical protein